MGGNISYYNHDEIIDYLDIKDIIFSINEEVITRLRTIKKVMLAKK